MLLVRNAGHSCVAFQNSKRENSISLRAVLRKLRLQLPRNRQRRCVARKSRH